MEINLRDRTFLAKRPLDRLDIVATYGGKLRLRVKTIDVNLASGVTVANWIPKGVVILGMSARFLTTVGCDNVAQDRTTFTVSDGTATWLSGAVLTASVGAAGTVLEMGANIGAVTEPKIRAAAGALTFAASGGSAGTPNSGIVRVTMWYLDTTAPSA